MLFIHSNNPEFTFYTSKWLRKFNKWKLELEKELICFIEKTFDYKNWLIKMEEIKKLINTDDVKQELTNKELKNILNIAWIHFNKNANKSILQTLVDWMNK